MKSAVFRGQEEGLLESLAYLIKGDYNKLRFLIDVKISFYNDKLTI